MRRWPEPLPAAIQKSSLASLAGLVPHYLLFYLVSTPLLTDALSQWIMAHTPSRYAVPILSALGAWAKPWAQTGALAALGFGVFAARAANFALPRFRPWLTAAVLAAIAASLAFVTGYDSVPGALSFWAVALLVTLALPARAPAQPVRPAARRDFLSATGRLALPAVMASGIVAVAVESRLRDRAFARAAVTPQDLFPFLPPLDRQRFASGLVRSAVTPLPEFYGMSKNTVDPNVDARAWRLHITCEGRLLRALSYPELLALPRQIRFQTLRCISNTLHSDLMGTAAWAGVHLSQLIDRRSLPSQAIEAALIGVDGHDDSLPLDYIFAPEALLALGMNGKTLSRTHGFPLRLLAPRYYGCRNVKWIGEIRFVSRPYFGTWQRLGYTREPVVHTASHIDRQRRLGPHLQCGGVSFAGDRGIRAVRLRVNRGPWAAALTEPALSPYSWTRWCAELPARPGDLLEANAQDGAGAWQELAESGPFPNGLAGPTVVRVNV